MPAASGARLGNTDIEFWMISNRIMPPVVAVLPIYLMFQKLSLLDTHAALIATYTAVNLPIVVWLTRDFFAAIPYDLEESAEIDGASKFRIFFTIALPLARAGLVATFLLVLILGLERVSAGALPLQRQRPDHADPGLGPERHARPAMVVHVGADRHHDRPGHRHHCRAAKANRPWYAGRRDEGLSDAAGRRTYHP